LANRDIFDELLPRITAFYKPTRHNHSTRQTFNKSDWSQPSTTQFICLTLTCTFTFFHNICVYILSKYVYYYNTVNYNYGNYYDCTDFDGTNSLNAAEMLPTELQVGSHLRYTWRTLQTEKAALSL